MRKKSADGTLGESKGFGYITFTKHYDALKALRLLNNNPKTFGPLKRPIIEFSIESQSATKKKQKSEKKSADDNDDYSFCEELNDLNMPFMGVKAKPLKDEEKVVAPKLNRKVFEAGKKLKEKTKTIKLEKRSSKQQKIAEKNQKFKNIAKRENKFSLKRKGEADDELDNYEKKYLNTRKKFDAPEVTGPQKVNKKIKWYDNQML